MNDFTLVIPTFNRPRELAALLRYLAAHDVGWPILVLDSSYEPTTIPQEIGCLTYLTETHPFDKFRWGLNHVTTEYCAFLADDDLYIPDALEQCVQAMRDNPRASVVLGWPFLYDENLELKHKVRKNSSIVDADPFMRFARMFAHYSAPTYGVYRTATLKRVLAGANAFDNILTRELLAAALTAIEGEIIYVPRFTHGRSCGAPAQAYENCHPVWWLLNDADGMFRDYVALRSLLAKAFAADGEADEQCVAARLNMIFLQYLRQTVNLSVSVDADQITVEFKDHIDATAPDFELTPEEREQLCGVMRAYKAAYDS